MARDTTNVNRASPTTIIWRLATTIAAAIAGLAGVITLVFAGFSYAITGGTSIVELAIPTGCFAVALLALRAANRSGDSRTQA